eukprot:m.34737 g.34737  ORF g.34737 m.34737 type:complete len:53 (-) comp12335_c0_seq1:980-1138(-)
MNAIAHLRPFVLRAGALPLVEHRFQRPATFDTISPALYSELLRHILLYRPAS